MGTSIFSPQSGTISVEYDNVESELLPNQNVLIATGSLPTQLPFLPFNHNTVLSSNDILQLTDLPASIAIIGGGVIGLEFASLLIDLGVNVSVIEAGERILPNESAQIANFLKTSLIARGVTFYENCALNESAVKVNSNSVTIQVNKDKTIEVEKVLVSIGRKPNTDDIGLNNTKIKTDDNGNILVNDFYKPKISIFMPQVIA